MGYSETELNAMQGKSEDPSVEMAALGEARGALSGVLGALQSKDRQGDERALSCRRRC